MNARALPFIAVMIAGALWATSGLIGEWISFHPLILTECRLLIGAIALVLYIGPARLIPLLSRAAWKWLFLAALGMAVFQWTFFVLVRMADASFATWSTVANGPVWALLIALLLKTERERGSRSDFVSALITVPGLMLIGWGFSWTALLVSLAGGLGYAVYASAAARLGEGSGGETEALLITAFALGGGALILGPLVWNARLVTPALHWRFSDLLGLAFLGLCSTALAYVFFAKGASRIGAQKALAFQWVQPVVTEFLSLSSPSLLSLSWIYLLGIVVLWVSMFVPCKRAISVGSSFPQSKRSSHECLSET